MYKEYDLELPWDKPGVTPEEALDFLGVRHTNPLHDGELEHLIAEGFPAKALDLLEKEIFLGKALLWEDLMEPIYSARVTKPDRLTHLESSRAYHVAFCWLRAFKLFKSEVSARTFLLKKHDLLFGMTALECILEGGSKRRRVIETLESLSESDWIEPHWHRHEY